MRLHDLKPAPGSKHRRKRIGRGPGSGRGGHTSTRGQKGQGSRSGSSTRPGFEGGQLPLARRLPKRGFNNIFGKDYTVVRLDRVAVKFEKGETVDAETLKARGVISRIGRDGVKILGNGTIEHALTVKVAKLTRSAADKITAAGGTIEEV